MRNLAEGLGIQQKPTGIDRYAHMKNVAGSEYDAEAKKKLPLTVDTLPHEKKNGGSLPRSSSVDVEEGHCSNECERPHQDIDPTMLVPRAGRVV